MSHGVAYMGRRTLPVVYTRRPLQQLVIVVCLLFLTVSAARPTCSHDTMQTNNIAQTTVQYTSTQFEHIRITLVKGNKTISMSKPLLEAIKDAVNDIESFVKVVPVSSTDKLKLKRKHACARYIRNGTKEMCIEQDFNNKDEDCPGGFIIPEHHLEQVEIYKGNGQPIYTIGQKNAGATNTDYILYYESVFRNCAGQAGMFATICQTDQNNRPVAGYLNICPTYTNRPIKKDTMKLDVIHQLIHALGFSKSMFGKFKNCSGSAGPKCPDLFKTAADALDHSSGVSRLQTPGAVGYNRAFSTCSSPTHGPAINQSHLDPRMNFLSIMSPPEFFDIDEITYLDPMTSTILEDTGWYRINKSVQISGFSESPYNWGKDAGCDFGLDCQRDNTYFCAGRVGEMGCDVSHTYKSPCTSGGQLSTCPFVVPKTQDSCKTGKKKNKYEHYGNKGACFYTDFQSVTMSGMCLKYECDKKGELKVKLPDCSKWKSCNNVVSVSCKVSGRNVTAFCPPAGVLCKGGAPTVVAKPTVRPLPPTTISTIPATTSGSTVKTTWSLDPQSLINVEIIFQHANFTEVQLVSAQFKQVLRSTICSITGVSTSRIGSTVELRRGSVHAVFLLQGSTTANDGPHISDAVSSMKTAISNRQLAVDLGPGSPRYRATGIRVWDSTEEGEDQGLNSIHVIAGIFGALLLVGVVVVGLITGMRIANARQGRVSPVTSRATSADTRSTQTRVVSEGAVTLHDMQSPNTPTSSVLQQSFHRVSTTILRE